MSIKYYATEEYVNEAIADLGNVGGSGVTSWNDLEDKPFYKQIEIIEDSLWQINGVETVDTGNGYAQATINSFPNTLNCNYGNAKVTVELNGIKYETQYFNSGSYGHGFGDIRYDPFEIYEGSSGKRLRTKEAGIYDVKVYIIGETVKTIDYDLLPEGFPRINRVEGVIIDNHEFSSDSYIYDPKYPLLADTTYTVIFDSVEYVCDSVVSQGAYIVIGNLHRHNSMYEDNGLPFAISYRSEYKELLIMDVIDYVESRNHTITIKGLVEQSVPMDKKFIPKIQMKWNDLTSKPFNIIPTDEIIPEQTVTYNNNMLGQCDLVVGETYIVYMNGEEYIVTCFDDGGYPTIGSPYGSYDNYPFSINSENGTAYISAVIAAPYTISLYGCKLEYTSLLSESLSILTSPNGTKFKLSVTDDGTLSAVAVE